MNKPRENADSRTVECQVCMHRCRLAPGQSGRCRARTNADGTIRCSNYGQLTAMALDPVEKKPLSRFCPGSQVLSVGSFGCNLACPFCQNHEISMCGPDLDKIVRADPEKLVRKALELKSFGNIGVAYTYNEPLVGYEFVADTARLARQYGLKNVVVTNGSVSLSALEQVLDYTDAMNIDLKGFSQDYYKKLGGDLDTVLRFIRRAAEGCHVELTTLVVPGENDTDQEMEELASWVGALDPRIPLHVTRFFPRYRMTQRGPTPVADVHRLAGVARKHLKYVYVGNC